MLSWLDFAVTFRDDILLKSENQEEHKKNVYEVFKRIQDYRFKLKDEKYDFFLNKIKYLGQIIDKNGRRPDPAQTSAIKDIPGSENVSSLQFPGFGNLLQCLCARHALFASFVKQTFKKDSKWV